MIDFQLHMQQLLGVLIATSLRLATSERTVSWWFDVAENATVDAMNVAAIAAHRDVFSRVMPYNARVALDGNVSRWWNDDKIATWNQPLHLLAASFISEAALGQARCSLRQL